MQQLQDYFAHQLQAIDSRKSQLYSRSIPFIKSYLPWLTIGLVVSVAIIIFFMQSDGQTKVQGITISAQTATSSANPQVASLKVDVGGAVNQPGVKSLQEGDRIEDALRAADGLSDKADTEYVAMKINLAAKVKDGDKIFIPLIEQNINNTTNNNSQSSSNSVEPSSSSAKVSVNQASDTQLDTLPGVGATYISRIIAGRPYSSIDDFCGRDIFRSKTTCDKIRPLITL